MRRWTIFSVLLLLVNALQFNIVEGEGGGSAGDSGEGDAGEGEAGSAGGEGEGSGSGTGNEGDSGNANDVASLPEWSQKLIKELRSESATSRTKNKDLESRFGNLEKGLKSALGLGDDDTGTPEEQINGLTGQNEQLAMRNSILEVALENGLNGDQSDYFGYLLQKEGDSLEDDEELSEERYEELVGLAKKLGGAGKAADTDVDSDGKTPPAGGGETVTLDEFSNMGYSDKVALRSKNEVLYNKLFKEAMSKGLI